MALFLNLYLGHLLGDFLFQPGKLVVAKRRGAPGLLTHTAIVGLCCTAVLLGDLAEHWSSILLIVAAHAGIELITIAAYQATPTRSLFTFLLDQVMHILSIVLVVYVVGALQLDERASTFGIDLAIGDLAVATALVGVGLLGSIFVFEAANTVLRGAKNVILRFDAARIGGVLERAGGLALMLWISPLALPLAFIPRAAISLSGDPSLRRRRLVEMAAGALLCISVYVLLVAADAATVTPILS